MKTALNRTNVYSIYKDAPPPKLKEPEPIRERVVVEKVVRKIIEPQVEQKEDTIIVNPTSVVNFPEPQSIKPSKSESAVEPLKPKVIEPKPIGNLELEKVPIIKPKPKYVPQPKVKKEVKSNYRATGLDILETGDQIKKLKTWEDFSSFLAKLSSKNLTLMAKGQSKPLDNFNFDGKWLTFTVSGIKAKQVIPGLWKSATIGRI